MSAPESARCCVCGAPLVPDEIALTRKLINRGAQQYQCLSCLAGFFGCSTGLLQEKSPSSAGRAVRCLHRSPHRKSRSTEPPP